MNKLDIFKIYIFMLVYTLLFIGEFLVNQITHSLLILVDSYYNLFQICTLIFFLIDHKTSFAVSIKATFGWARLSILGNLVSHCFFAALAFALLVEGMQLLVHVLHEQNNLKPHLNLLASITSIMVQILSSGIITRILNKKKGNILIQRDHVEMHFAIKKPIDDLEMENFQWEDINIPNQCTNKYLKMEHVKDEPAQAKKLLKNYNSNSHSSSLNKFKQEKLNEKFINYKKYKTEHKIKIFRNFVSSFILMINSLIGCFLLNTKYVELEYANKIIQIIDPIFSVLAVFLICSLIYPEIKKSTLILLQTFPSYIDLELLKKKLINMFPIVVEIHELHIWCLTPDKIIATCHIKLNEHFKNTNNFNQFLYKLNNFFREEGIHLATVQPEFVCLNNLNNQIKFNSEKETDENLLNRTPSCLFKCMNSEDDCIQKTCCHKKSSLGECNELGKH